MHGDRDDELLKLLAGDPAEALTRVRRELAQAPADPELLAFEAECQGELGDFEGAARPWGRLLTLDPEVPAAYVERARLFGELGRVTEALAALAVADALFGDAGQALLVRGFVAEVQGDWAAAEQAFARAVEVDAEIDPPCRLPPDAVLAALRAVGAYTDVTLLPMPVAAGVEGFGRAVDVAEGPAITVYQRNIERELPHDGSPQEFVELVAEVLSGA